MAAENLSPSVMASVARQIRALAKSPPEGVRYIPGAGSLTEIHAEISGPEETPFEGGKFRLRLVLGGEYPAAPPKGFFITKIFHPNIAEAGDICVNTLKRDWKPSVTLSHILGVIRCLLIVPFPESSLNDEAGKLFMDSYEEFCDRAALMTRIHAKPSASPESADRAHDAGAASGGGGAAAAAATAPADETAPSAGAKAGPAAKQALSAAGAANARQQPAGKKKAGTKVAGAKRKAKKKGLKRL